MSKELLFSITAADLDVQTFRCGGKGGQNVNKRDTGVRIVHKASGAEGRACDERTQGQNKKIAFKRMADSDKFKVWMKTHTAMLLQGYRDAEQKVEEMMKEENLKVDFFVPGCNCGFVDGIRDDHGKNCVSAGVHSVLPPR